MNEVVKELLNSGDLSKYPQSEHENLLMPLALAKKEARLQNKPEIVEKIDFLINSLQLIPEVIETPVVTCTTRPQTANSGSQSFSSRPISSFSMRSRPLTASTLRNSSADTVFTNRFILKERNRLLELKDKKRAALLDKQQRELEELRKPVKKPMEPYNELEVVTKLISIRNELMKPETTPRMMKTRDVKSGAGLVESLRIRYKNETNENRFKEKKNALLSKQKKELEDFDREWYLKMLEFDGNSRNISSFSQSLPTVKLGSTTKFVRTLNTFA